MRTWDARLCQICGDAINTIVTSKGGKPRKYCPSCKPSKGGNRASYSKEYVELNFTNWFRKKVQGGKAGAGRNQELSVEDCLYLLQKQEGRCALTGVRLTHKLNDPRAASIDCILPQSLGGSYAIGNVQLVCTNVNYLRGQLSLGEFRVFLNELVESIVENRSQFLP